MKTHKQERGSAMLLALIVSLLVIGLSGAFLAETVWRGQTQFKSIESDEAQVIVDAGMEKARRALWVYHQSSTTWTWNQILQYCQNAQTSFFAGNATDLNNVRNNYNAIRMTSPDFMAYGYTPCTTAGLHTNPAYEAPTAANVTVPAPPYNTSSNSPDATNLKVILGWNTPYLKGAFHVMVTNNSDDPGGATSDTDRKVLVTVTATLPDGTQRQSEAFVYDPPPKTSQVPAAVSSNDFVQTLGNITIDGRDFDINGNLVPGAGGFGVFGIVSKQGVTVGGSSATGGNGIAPPGGGGGSPAGTTDDFYTGALPTDADSTIGFPDGLPAGTLKAQAQGSGTYFTSQAQYDAFLSANGGNMPGGKVVYLEGFNPGPPFEIGGTMNTTPSIIVVHNATSTSVVKNIHGNFKGLLLTDSIDKVNAGTNILGAVFAYSTSNPDILGNGSANIKFSSAVLLDLPAGKSDSLTVLSYRKLK